ncbi:MAG: hypothetical protein CVV24_00375 [Ignavibacteriae bacterium HGW-Ignavibacteriae-3]|nr:MAG: hypothetical protein CVV24_00375 [Ignavibacteriae bacterium HGW-Ignavibacteriae-3]
MKKLITIVCVAILTLPLNRTAGQSSGVSSSLGYAFNDATQEFIVQSQGKEMSKEEEEKLLKSLSPEIKAKLEDVKKLNKDKYYQLLRESSSLSYYFQSSLAERYTTGKALSVYEEVSKERNEKIKKQKELEIDVELYVLKLKNADNANQALLKKDLQSALGQLFDIRESQKQEEVKQLEKRLQELKESLQARKQNKDEIIQRRIQELLGNSKYLRWE